MRLKVIAALAGLLSLIMVPAGAYVAPFGDARPHVPSGDGSGGEHGSLEREPGKDLSPYKHLGTWIDMYNKWPWDNPKMAVGAMAKQGASTLYLQTSNWGKDRDLYRPRALGRFVDAAHDKGMKVVAWYVPEFKNLRKDWRRTKAAIDFETKNGERFDSFALDIEATVVNDILRRNTRLMRLTETIRRYVGESYALGAITPEAGARYWPSFPYASLAKYYDVFLPMGYFSYRVNGKKAVSRYTAYNIATIREATGQSSIPIHFIGGIAGETSVREVAGFVETVRSHGIAGASYYDFPITTQAEWDKLSAIAKP
jgi:hypothetical protein